MLGLLGRKNFTKLFFFLKSIFIFQFHFFTEGLKFFISNKNFSLFLVNIFVLCLILMSKKIVTIVIKASKFYILMNYKCSICKLSQHEINFLP